MTVRLSNIHQTWANSDYRYVGLGLNIDSTGYHPDSSLLEISINNDLKLRLSPDGVLYPPASNSSNGGSSTDVIPAFNKANIAYDTAVSAYASANSLSISVPSAYSVANSGYSTSGAAFTKANNAILAVVGAQSNATAAFAQANIALGTAQGSFLQSNNQTITIASSYGQANIALSVAQASFLQSNNQIITIASVYSLANDHTTTLNSSYTQANNAILGLVGVASNSAAAFLQANVSLSTAQGAFLQSNNQIITLASAYAEANGANARANVALITAVGAFDRANTGGVGGGYSNGAILVSQQFLANGVSNTFTVIGGYIPNQLLVFLNGIKQTSNDIIITTGSTLGFPATPANNDIIDVFGYQSYVTIVANTIVVGNSTSNTTITSDDIQLNGVSVFSSGVTLVSQQFTANGVSNTFNIPTGYNANELLVFLNGVKQLAPTDVIISSGSDIVFTATPSNNAIIDAFGYTYLNIVDDTAVIALSTAQSAFAKANTVITTNAGIFVGNSTSNVAISNGVLSISGSNISPVQSFRNKIINGNFDIWQRGTNTITAGYQTADRFATYRANSTFVTSNQSFTLGQTDVPNEPTYWHRTVVTSVAGANNYCHVIQPIESVRTLAGKKATISFYAKADSTKNMSIELQQNYGTGGSPSANTSNMSSLIALTNTWSFIQRTFDVPSISGKTIGTNNNDYLGLIFWFDAGSTYNSRTNSLGQQSGTFDIAQVQLEEGSVATPFELRPIGLETLLCQRYCQRIGDSFNAIYSAYATSGSTAYAGSGLPAEMRAVPTTTKIGTWNVSNCGQPTINASKNQLRLQFTITATGVGLVYAGTGLYVLLSAEL